MVLGEGLVGAGRGVDGVAVGVGVGSGVLDGVGVGVGVGCGTGAAASQLTTSIWRSALEVSITQRWTSSSARVLRTRAPEPSVAAGARASSWSRRGTRAPWRMKS